MTDLVVMGGSWGGFKAVAKLLGALPSSFPAPLAVALHRSPDMPDDGLAESLGSRSPLPVREAEDKTPVEPGVVHVAPADYHLLVEPDGFVLSVDERVQHSRPSIDVLFESAADAYGPGVVGVLLTGANADGAQGMARIRRRGGRTIAQDPASAERPRMPEAAIAAGAVDEVLPLDAIPPRLVELVVPGAAGRGSRR